MAAVKASGVVYLLREIQFKVYALCAEMMQILVNSAVLVLYEATLYQRETI